MSTTVKKNPGGTGARPAPVRKPPQPSRPNNSGSTPSSPRTSPTSAPGRTARTVDTVSLSRTQEEPVGASVQSLRSAWGAEEADTGTARAQSPDPNFQYSPQNYRDLSEAQAYSPLTELGSKRMTGTQANEEINRDYHQINTDMQRYLTGNPQGERLPDVADWTTFGKYASREAGENIRNTEDVLQALTGDAKAATDLLRNGITDTNLKQGAAVGTDIFTRAVGKNAGSFLQAASKQAQGNPQGAVEGFRAAQDSSGEAGKFAADSLFKVNQGLVTGNTEIHKNIAPAYDAFLSGESSGKGGLEGLKEAGYFKGSEKDRQGFVSGAFADYQKARDLGIQAQNETDPAKKQDLIAKRQQLMERGNLMIGMQEQMEILQRPGIFEDPDMQRVIGASAGTMNLTDANGRHDLLPNGGNWTDFQTRMGLNLVKPGTQGSIPVTHPDGATRHYTPDPTQKGTIVEYFTQNASGAAARNLNQSAPRPVETTPTTGTGRSLDGIGSGLNRGNAGQVIANSAALPSRVAGDLSGVASEALKTNAESHYDAGYRRLVRGQAQGGVHGAAVRVAGAAQLLEGGLNETLSDYSRGAARGFQAVGNHTEKVVRSYDNGVVMPWDSRAVWWFGSNPFAR